MSNERGLPDSAAALELVLSGNRLLLRPIAARVVARSVGARRGAAPACDGGICALALWVATELNIMFRAFIAFPSCDDSARSRNLWLASQARSADISRT